METIESQALPFAGKKVYAAGVIAAYTVFANIPVGCVLYGLNLCARGATQRGRLLVVLGIGAEIALVVAVLMDRASSRLMLIVALFAALFFYQVEKAAVRSALQGGASLARWWPPALFVAGVLVAIFAVTFFI